MGRLNPVRKTPIYPDLKKVTTRDADFLSHLTKKFPPYCDFAFSTIHNWGLRLNENKYSTLNDNLVLIIRDNHGNKFVPTFLGTHKPNETAYQIIKDHGPLHYIPEEITNLLDPNIFHIEEDRNSFDYIFEIEKITALAGNELKRKRKEIRYFTNTHENIEIKDLDMNDPVKRHEMLRLYRTWARKKKSPEYIHMTSLSCELRSLKRFLKYNHHFKSLAMGVYVNEKLIGFSINEFLQNETVLKNFVKANNRYRGIFSFLTYTSCLRLKEMGYKYINNEMDMGIDNLRNKKMEWRPCGFLRKYTVSLKEDNS